MRKKFTLLIAACALLSFLAIPMGMWGQATTYTSNVTLSTTNGSNASTATIKVNSTDIGYSAIKLGTKDKTGYAYISVPANTTTLHVHCAGWNNDGNNRTLNLTTEAAGVTISPTSMTLTNDSGISGGSNAFTLNTPANAPTSYYASFTLTGVTEETTIKLATSVKRAVYWGINAVTGTTPSLEDNDLALTDAPVALTFDLYNNSDAQVIHYTTLSTGEVTVVENNFIEADVDEDNQTITVTPVAVTPSTQTITVSQEADETYDIGFATFTVAVTNSAPQHTVTYHANVTGTSEITDNYYEGDDVTIRPANTFSNPGYAFTKWHTNAAGTGGTDYNPGDVINNIQANIDLYAQWEESSETTVALNIQSYGTAQNWGNGTKHTSITMNGVTFTASDGTNTGTYYNNVTPHQWRFYQSESATITISVPDGNHLVSITPTYASQTNGVLLNGSTSVASGSTVNVSGTSVTFSVGNSSTATNGQVRFTNIDVTYASEGGSQTTSDLTITNASTNLTFDLYNNTTAQVINYTTSSTGAITVTPASPTDYFSYVHDATAKTITVTPLAVTPSAQTVTISQEADATYYGGTATFTVSVANSDPSVPGTENNPYTVAQARAAIDAGTGTQEVYVTGIISQVDDYNSTYHSITYWISSDGTTTSDQLEVYSGKGLNNTNFSSIDDVELGATVIVYGDLKMHNEIYEFNYNNYLVSYTAPVITEPTITISPTTVNATYASSEGTLNVTYQNITTVVAEVYFCDANGDAASYNWLVADIDNNNNVYYTIDDNNGAARTAYFKVWANDDDLNEVYSELVTINQAQYVVDYATLPFSFDGVYADIEGTAGLTESGIDHSDYSSSPHLKFNTQGDYLILHFNDVPGELSFNIKGNSLTGTYSFSVLTSTDGVTYTSIASYTSISGTGSGDNITISNLATNVRFIKWEYTTKDGGNVGLGNINLAAYVAPTPTITLNSYSINATAAETDGTLAVTYTEIETSASVEIIWCDENGDALSDQSAYADWLLADFATGDINTIEYTIGANDGSARTAYFKVYGVDAEVNDVYSDLVTISQAAYVAPVSGTWVLTTLAELTPADVFVIVGNNGDTYALPSTQTNSAPLATAIEVNSANNPHTLTNDPATSLQWNLVHTNNGYVFYPYGETTYWLNCTSSNNGVRVSNTNGNAKHFTLDESGYLTTTETTNQRYLGIYSSQDWRTYESTTGNIAGQTFSFFKKVSAPVSYTKTIDGYSGDFNLETNPNGDYYLIASPVASVTPTAGVEGNGFLDNKYDLYYFDQSEDDEWRNFEVTSFDLVSGKGYLYANSTSTTLTFEGQPYNGNGIVPLTYVDGKSFAGWNLIGNPFGEPATLDQPYYRLNTNGDALNTDTEGGTVAVMEGVFVQATSATRAVVFTPVRSTNGNTVDPQAVSKVNIKVMRTRGGAVIDNAILRFDNGSMLDKFVLNENSTKLYISQEGNDYAIVNAQAEGEMPLSFKAEENGNYILSVNIENVEMNYLHLIDNMTGANVDLLATPSYSFEARTTDYASRFRLVFSANDASTGSASDDFAFFNGSEWVINCGGPSTLRPCSATAGSGAAILQVVDVMGRVLSSETVSGNANVSLNQTPGVYMLRLVNSDSVRTQKIVVR